MGGRWRGVGTRGDRGAGRMGKWWGVRTGECTGGGEEAFRWYKCTVGQHFPSPTDTRTAHLPGSAICWRTWGLVELGRTQSVRTPFSLSKDFARACSRSWARCPWSRRTSPAPKSPTRLVLAESLEGSARHPHRLRSTQHLRELTLLAPQGSPRQLWKGLKRGADAHTSHGVCYPSCGRAAGPPPLHAATRRAGADVDVGTPTGGRSTASTASAHPTARVVGATGAASAHGGRGMRRGVLAVSWQMQLQKMTSSGMRCGSARTSMTHIGSTWEWAPAGRPSSSPWHLLMYGGGGLGGQGGREGRHCV